MSKRLSARAIQQEQISKSKSFEQEQISKSFEQEQISKSFEKEIRARARGYFLVTLALYS